MQGDPYGTQNGVYGLAHLIHQYLTQGMRYEPPPPGPNVAAVQGPQIVANELQRNPDAIAAGESAVDSAMDQVMTDQWKQRMADARAASPQGQRRAFINKMRAAKAGQKAVGKELAKPAPEPPPDPAEARAKMGAQEWHPSGVANPPPEPMMPMTPPHADQPWKTPDNTIGGFFGGEAVKRSLFGTQKPDPQE